MIDKELLEILACPETHQPLSLADEATVKVLNANIGAGKMTNVGGEPVTEAVDGGLVREDGKIVYPIRESIPVLLIQAGIPI
ncbi:MAG: Trm112 family protein [Planctomycetota bacterium]|nr:Trm112 family protein [Planctomycetota bacterium]MDG2144262.1 Trm112 family protein [Planctomycetota bacterium]